MSADEEFLGAMNAGVPAEELASILVEHERRRAIESLPENNPDRFSNPQAQRLSDTWFERRKTSTVEQKDEVGRSYLMHIIGLTPEETESFVKADYDLSVYHKVGLIQGGAQTAKADYGIFWVKMALLFPEDYQTSDMAFLAEKCGSAAIWHFLSQIEPARAEASSIVRRIRDNAMVYK